MKIGDFFKLFITVFISEFAGIIGSVFATGSVDTWYAALVKPALNLPNWVFGPVWTALYALMGIAAFLVWKNGWARKEVKIALGIFSVQLVLNIAWPIIFFGLRNPSVAFVEIILLWLIILVTIIAFSKISRVAVWLLVPYILWVSFAGYLNYSIWILNQTDSIACTMDAKLCSDGSYVGRIPPNCSFAFCPKENLIRVENPGANEVITSPLTIKGEARGFWFFEADFPLVLTDWDGRIISEGYATADGEWMTEDFVSFEGVLEFEKPRLIGGVVNRGALILMKDNPSGLPEHDDALEIPIMFDSYSKD